MTGPVALLSVSDKRGLVEFAEGLSALGFTLVASGGTASALKNANIDVSTVAQLTGAAEILGGRVKTLHPAIHAGILCRPAVDGTHELSDSGYRLIQLVVCNLYPFSDTIARATVTLTDALDNIDIGGVTLLRAAAKTHCRVTVVCDPGDYQLVLQQLRSNRDQPDTQLETRERLALKAFLHTAHYDDTIAVYLSRVLPGANSSSSTTSTTSTTSSSSSDKSDSGAGTSGGERAHLALRYGMNPHQSDGALLLAPRVGPWAGRLPLTVLWGQPGFINLLDALNSWQLVRELRQQLQLPAAASFKHVSPAGAAVAVPLDHTEACVCMVADLLDSLSPLATAYARARSADRLSSFGDFIALSDQCDEITARVIAREVSDGVIAPGYSDQALAILKKKKGGKYCVLQMDVSYVPDTLECRTVFGLRLQQARNTAPIDTGSFNNIVTKHSGQLSEHQLRDLLVASVALKYTQSNSVCVARHGQLVGVGAGQQSRIHCTRLAAAKSDLWWLRHHPHVLQQVATATSGATGGATRAQLSNSIDAMVRGEAGLWEPLSADQRRQWLGQADGFVLSSDAFLPFADNIERARQSGVTVVAAPAGSVNDAAVTEAAERLGVTLVHTQHRLFHH